MVEHCYTLIQVWALNGIFRKCNRDDGINKNQTDPIHRISKNKTQTNFIHYLGLVYPSGHVYRCVPTHHHSDSLLLTHRSALPTFGRHCQLRAINCLVAYKIINVIIGTLLCVHKDF